MSSPRYIFVDDQGGVFSSEDEPTPEDLAHAAVGVVTILRIADFHAYGSQRKWAPIRRSEPATLVIDGHETSPFHW